MNLRHLKYKLILTDTLLFGRLGNSAKAPTSALSPSSLFEHYCRALLFNTSAQMGYLQHALRATMLVRDNFSASMAIKDRATTAI
ncbi:MAG: hypothetical protein ACI80S_000500 [Pseudohongiellaceae bacterium]|jgi:hypothetical protein